MEITDKVTDKVTENKNAEQTTQKPVGKWSPDTAKQSDLRMLLFFVVIAMLFALLMEKLFA